MQNLTAILYSKLKTEPTLCFQIEIFFADELKFMHTPHLPGMGILLVVGQTES